MSLVTFRIKIKNLIIFLFCFILVPFKSFFFLLTGKFQLLKHINRGKKTFCFVCFFLWNVWWTEKVPKQIFFSRISNHLDINISWVDVLLHLSKFSKILKPCLILLRHFENKIKYHFKYCQFSIKNTKTNFLVISAFLSLHNS